MKLLTIFSLFLGLLANTLSASAQASNTKSMLSSQTPKSASCGLKFKHKSDSLIAAMTPRQLIEEAVFTQTEPNSFDSYAAWADYDAVINKYVRKAGAKMLPLLTEYLNAYDPKNASGCKVMSFFVASKTAGDLDRYEFRIKATKDGRSAIDALELAISRMRAAGFDKIESEYQDNRGFRLHSTFLKDLKGVNEVDRSIKDTFWVLHKIEISDSELLEFSNFLISRDPAYPTWSDTNFIKDYSRINEWGNPLQVYVRSNPEPYFNAYLEFKNLKSKSELGISPPRGDRICWA